MNRKADAASDNLNVRLFLRVNENTRTRFRNIARSAGKTESELLREIIAIVIEQQTPVQPEPVVPVPAHTYPDQLTLRLPSFLLDAVRERAKKEGMSASRWVASLVQSNLLKIPVMTSDELRVLGHCIHELSSIGRNLNQVARVLNADFRETAKLKVELLEVLQASVMQTQEAVRALARAANQRWDSL
jgi:hypothetical protein